MSRTLDLHNPGFPHGTPDGYRHGCRGSACGSPASCRDVYTRYQGDYSFKKLIDAGVPAADILAQEAADRDAMRERDRAAARAQRRAEQAAPRPTRHPRRQSPSTTRHRPGLRDNLRALHTEGLTDVQIAQRMGVTRSRVGALRRELALPANRPPRTPRPPREGIRTERAQRIRELHAAGLTDQEIADQLGVTRKAAQQSRLRLHLPVNRAARPRRERHGAEPRHDYRPDIARLHGEGLTDAQIAERLDLSPSYTATLRRGLALPANRSERTRWDGAELQPHGTNACYARGCRQPECHEAHKQYHRDYVKRRREKGARQHHGTAYGYQLGCRNRSTCPATPSCADASLAAEAARRRAAGAPAKVLVDAAPVQAHIHDLIHAGITVDRIAEQSGLTFAIVRKMIHSRGKERGIVTQVLAERAAAILSIPLPGRVPA